MSVNCFYILSMQQVTEHQNMSQSSLRNQLSDPSAKTVNGNTVVNNTQVRVEFGMYFI